ncbi:MAG TPA: hypothetical protein VK759_01415 [Rhizomicrobium sp.]|jgi:hypothetical protein|nr:hypothetical protein [Rhizomicrobium sp.]
MVTIDNNSSATPWLAFLIGALIVAVVVLGFVMFTGGHIPGMQQQVMPSHMNVTVKAPPAPSH